MASADQWNCQEQRFQPVTEILECGRCEPLKAGVHGVLLATAAVCAAYNTAAWIRRRESHLAINAIIYSAAIWWERCHIVHHLAARSAVEPEEQPQEDLIDAA